MIGHKYLFLLIFMCFSGLRIGSQLRLRRLLPNRAS